MKRYYVLMFGILIVLLLGSCSSENEIVEAYQKDDQIKEVQKSEDLKKVDQNQEDQNLEDLSNLVGTYYYDDNLDATDIIEDHYMVIEMDDDKFSGKYYGTSDDFDPAREGYYVGFYVAQMTDLYIDKKTIRFSVKLYPKDVFSSPVDLQYKSSEEIPITENSKWINAHIFDENNGLERLYEGKFEGEDILLDTDYGVRVFKKLNK